ncbi:MAG TPA: hypothetical protein VHV77_16595 [Pirellulales bacterium]|nr:hypothetical protein [Pirellulales bacterium]
MNSYLSGLRAIERRDYNLAAECFSQAVALDPSDADAFALRGCARLQQGEFELASGDVEAALRLSPNLARAFYVRGAIAHLRQNSIQATLDLAKARACDNDGLLDEMAHWDLVHRLEMPSDALQFVEDAAGFSPPADVVATADSAEPIDLSALGFESNTQPMSLLTKLHRIEGVGRVPRRSVVRAGIASTIVHAIAIVAMGVVVAQTVSKSLERPAMLVTMTETAEPFQGMQDLPRQASVEEDLGLGHDEAGVPLVEAAVTIEVPQVARAGGANEDLPARLWDVVSAGGDAPVQPPKAEPVYELADARSDESRKEAVIKRGGTPASEAAVERALQWLVRHQNIDGSWNFEHRFCGSCGGQCSDAGSLLGARIGATAMGVLPFLGAGHTHRADKYGKASPYRDNVDRALKFLVAQQQNGGPGDGAMTEPEGRMYDHGLAAIAVCEAYGMTQDKELMAPAQRSLQFIVAAQDPVGGGWRYRPLQPGDTSVVGWQLMALKSGYLAYLKVPPATIAGALRFLLSVQQDGGSRYGYTSAMRGTEGTMAVGLLCRMYLGWKREEPALIRGVELLDQIGPLRENMYFNYYATQVMHHFEGPMWTRWNERMRDGLIATQATGGHADGSWFFSGDKHGSRAGGRLYTTSLATMTLEVYYRHMPLYGKRAADSGIAR